MVLGQVGEDGGVKAHALHRPSSRAWNSPPSRQLQHRPRADRAGWSANEPHPVSCCWSATAFAECHAKVPIAAQRMPMRAIGLHQPVGDGRLAVGTGHAKHAHRGGWMRVELAGNMTKLCGEIADAQHSRVADGGVGTGWPLATQPPPCVQCRPNELTTVNLDPGIATNTSPGLMLRESSVMRWRATQDDQVQQRPPASTMVMAALADNRHLGIDRRRNARQRRVVALPSGAVFAP